MNASIQIWITETGNFSNPSHTCTSGVACNYSLYAEGGKAYQIFIKADNPISFNIEVTQLSINSPHTLYNQASIDYRTTVWCGNWFKYNLNKEFNGMYYCPMSVYKCNMMDSENRYTAALIPKYCTSHSWSSGVFRCSVCVDNAEIEDNLCVCNSGFAENHAQGTCNLAGYQLEINLYKVIIIQSPTSIQDFERAYLIITNSCEQAYNNFFCKENLSSNLLYKAKIIEFTPKDILTLSARANLSQGPYSITINYIKSGGLLRECWNNADLKRYRDTSDISNFIIPNEAVSCVWEGFFKAPESDLDIKLNADDVLILWLGDYSNILLASTLSTEEISIKLVKDKLYYIKMFYFNAVGNKLAEFNWKKTGITDWNSVTNDMLYYPTRPFWNIKHISSFDEVYIIPSNNPDHSIYYCPHECSSCDLYWNGGNSCKSCREGSEIKNGKCECKVGYGIDTASMRCIECPELASSCSYESNTLKSISCIENADKNSAVSCVCNENAYHFNNMCIEGTVCNISLTMLNIDPGDIILLDLMHYCATQDCEIEGFRRIKRYKESLDSISILSGYEYSLSIVMLEAGYLEFQYWDSGYTEASPKEIRKEDLNQDISRYTSGIGRYQGYFSLPATGEYDLIVDTNTVFIIYLSDDREKVYSFEDKQLHGYFTQDQFYFIRIQFEISKDAYFKLSAYYNGILYEISFYYPYKTENSPIYINSCNPSYVFEYKDIVTGIQFCPDLCSKCIQMIPSSDYAQYPNLCIECIESSELVNDRCECIDGYDFNSNTKSCEDYSIPFCISYDENLNCNQCKANFELKDRDCMCNTDIYKYEDESCVNQRLELSILPSTNSIQLEFNNLLKDHLDQSLIELSFSDQEIENKVSYKYSEILKYKIYSYVFEYPENIDRDLSIYISFTTNPTDIYDTTLDTINYSIQTRLYFHYDNEGDTDKSEEDSNNNGNIPQAQIEAIRNTASYSTAAVLGASSVASIVNLNPSSILRILNTLQIYRYLLILNLALPYRVKSIFQGFDTLVFIPNFSIRFLAKTGKEISQQYKDFGIDTSDFILNSGKQLLILIIFLVIYLALKTLWSLKLREVNSLVFKKIYTRILSVFEYGVFIGFWIEGYLDFILFSGLNLSNPQFESTHQIVSFALSGIFMILTLLYPAAFTCFYLKNIERLSEDTFSSKWSLLYTNYDLDKEYAVFEMIYFLMRRILIATSALFFNGSAYIQISIVSVSSFSILMFYISYNPYKESKVRFLAIFSEGCFFIVITSILVFLKENLSDDAITAMDWIISGALYISILIPFLVDLSDLFKKAYNLLASKCMNQKTHSIVNMSETQPHNVT